MVRAESELRQQPSGLPGRQSALFEKAREQRGRTGERAFTLGQLANDYSRPDPASPGGGRQLPKEQAYERGFASPVGADDRQPVTGSQFEVERPEAEPIALDHSFFEPGDDIAAAATGRQFEL